MKLRKLALLAALPAAVMVANAQADGPEVYGKLNLSFQDTRVTNAGAYDTKDWELDSNASRFGIMGSTTLDGSLKGIYKLELGTSIDNGDSSLTDRNSYVGVMDSWGTVIGGKFDSPTKEIRGKVDQFIDYKMADMANVLVGNVRPNNIVMYSSPKIADNITINAAIIPGEGNDVGGPGTGTGNNHVADGSSGSVVFDTSDLYLALAVDSHVNSGLMNQNGNVSPTAVGAPSLTQWENETDILRLAGQVKVMDDLALGAILQTAKEVNSGQYLTTGNPDKQKGAILSAAYTMDKETFKAQFGHSVTEIIGANDVTINSLTLGVDHSLSKTAKAYAYATGMKVRDIPGNTSDEKESTVGIGFEQKF
jgi:predicted porin